MIRVMNDTPLSTSKTKEGTPVLLTLSRDVVKGNVLIIPRGATVHGVVVQSKSGGALNRRSADLVLQLVSLEFGGETYPLYTYQLKVEGESKEPPKDDVVNGAFYGALAGGVVNDRIRGESTQLQKAAAMTAGAAIGAGVGTAFAAVTPRPPVDIPAECEMDFYLASPISVVPVSEREAARLSHRLPEGGPVLYVRSDIPQ